MTTEPFSSKIVFESFLSATSRLRPASPPFRLELIGGLYQQISRLKVSERTQCFQRAGFFPEAGKFSLGFPYASQIKMVAPTAPKEETKVAARA
jgi:hypothetical protein